EVDREEDDQKDKDVRQKLREALFTSEQQKALHEYIVLFRRVVQQTEKGRRPRFSVLAVVGNGNGLVGYGEGKHEEGEEAKVMAFKEAYRNMDYVPRFEKRTLFTPLRTKLGSTEIILRPRPVGFGLAVNPNIHKILTAAGIKDCGGKVWGSRTPLNVIKGTFRMLLSGNAPLSMGNGIGGPGRKLDKGSGVISKGDVERARGRKLV
ncbi:dsRNA-binding domain-like protein, partial [Punctularia strigosozonata HHB-11173 SS5]|uniref:dsRNA-binding domain-like protein n=1 Tax=Punctularia strigosozonata (strain HHB-11173) TaxID=741275 RepID=UPI000441697A